MKLIRFFFICMILLSSSFLSVNAGFFDSFISDGAPDIRYCDGDDECWLEQGIDVIKTGLDDIETTRTFSQYIQDVAVYLLWFIALVWVLYIMYAGFQILIWNGDEEKVKKSKQTILYVAIGIAVIFLAWSIVTFVLWVLGA